MRKFFIAAFGILLVTCTQEEIAVRNYPRVRTYPVDNITSDGAVFHGEVTFSSTEIIDHGFIWSTSKILTIEHSEHISLGPKQGKGAFETLVARSLAEGVKYSVKAYARSATHTVFGDVMPFESLGSMGPLLSSFHPDHGTWGDTIRITGKNFNKSTQNLSVRFDSIQAMIKSANDSSLVVFIPQELQKQRSAIAVTFSGKTSIKDGFQLVPPKIISVDPLAGNYNDEVTITGAGFNTSQTKVFFDSKEAVVTVRYSGLIKCKIPLGVSPGTVTLSVKSGDESLTVATEFFSEAPKIIGISPREATFGDEIIIQGEFFGPEITSNVVMFGNTIAEITAASETEIRAKVPEYLTSPEHIVTVTYNQEVATAENSFKLLPPTILSVSPDRISSNVLVTITGVNFSPYGMITVMFDSEEASRVEFISATEIKVRSPFNIYANTVNLSVTISGQTSNAAPLISPWKKLNNGPDRAILDRVGFVYNGEAYIGLSGADYYGPNIPEMWRFNPGSQQWKQLSNFPGGNRSDCISFKVGDKGYVGGGSVDSSNGKDLWEYDFSNDQWIEKNNLPFTAEYVYGVSGFSVDDKVFLLHQTELWQYDPLADLWIAKAEFPGGARFHPTTFSHNGELYVLGGNEYPYYASDLWKYSASADEWTYIRDVPPELSRDASAFTLDGHIYMGDSGGYEENNFWEYDPVLHEFNKLLSYGGVGSGQNISLILNGKSYLFNQYQGVNCWEFDPDL